MHEGYTSNKRNKEVMSYTLIHCGKLTLSHERWQRSMVSLTNEFFFNAKPPTIFQWSASISIPCLSHAHFVIRISTHKEAWPSTWTQITTKTVHLQGWPKRLSCTPLYAILTSLVHQNWYVTCITMYWTSISLSMLTWWHFPQRLASQPPMLDPFESCDNLWLPFNSRLEFEWAYYHYVRLRSSAEDIQQGLNLWRAAVSKSDSCDKVLLQNTKDMYDTIDSITVSGVGWTTYQLFYDGPWPSGIVPCGCRSPPSSMLGMSFPFLRSNWPQKSSTASSNTHLMKSMTRRVLAFTLILCQGVGHFVKQWVSPYPVFPD